MSVKVTVGQQTFIKKIVLGTPVTTARETLSIDEFTDFDVATKSDGQILVFDSSEGVFKNFTFDVGQGLAKEYSPGDDKLIIGIDSDKTPVVTGILSKGNLTPTLDSTFDLGDSNKKWRELYLSGGTIHLGGLNLKDSGGDFSIKDSLGEAVNIDLAGSVQQIRGFFSSGGDLSYDSATGRFQFDVEQVYTKTNFDSDLGAALSGGVGIAYDSATDTISIDSSELEANFKQDIRGYFSSSNSLNYNSTTGDFRLPQPLDSAANPTFTNITATGDVTFDSANAILFDKSDQSLKFGDNYKAKFGAGDDLQIYHSGGVNYVDGTATTIIRGNWLYLRKSGSAENYLIGKPDGAVELYYDNVKRFETTDSGVTVTGSIRGDSATVPLITADSALITDISGSTLNYATIHGAAATIDSATITTLSSTTISGEYLGFDSDLARSTTTQTIRGYVSATDAGGDGSFSYNNSTGVFTYTGPSASEVRSHFSAGGDLSYDSATGRFEFDVEQVYTKANFDSDFNVALDEAGTDGAGLAYNSTTNTLSIDSAELTSLYRQTIRGYISGTDAGGDGSFSYNASTGTFTYTGPSASEVRAHITGGSGIGDSVNGNGIIKIDSAELYSLYKHDDFSDFVADEHIAHSGVNITAGVGLNGGGNIAASRTINIDSAELTNYFRQTIRTYLNAVDAGGDGSFAYDSALGKFTYTGPSSTEVRAHLSASNSLSYNSSTGDFRLPQPLDSAANPTFNQLRGPASFIIDPAAIGDNTGTVRILGNLQVEGTQTIINSTTVSLNDKNIVIADSAADSSALDGGGITWGGASIVDTPTFNYSHANARLVSNREINAPLFSGSGASLTNLPAASLTGTIDSARIPTLLIADIGNINSIDHDALTNFVANEHIDHTAVSITAGFGLKGGGTIASTRDLAIDSSELTSYYRPLIRGYVSGGTGITYNSSTGEITTTDNEIVHDNLSGFVADEHVAHSGVSITAGFGLKGGGTIASTRDLAIDSAELLTYYEPIIRHDNLSGFVANEHIDHTSVSITAGNGLTGGGTIASTRTLTIDSSELASLYSKVIVHDNTNGFVADEHVAHTGVSIIAGKGLTGGGNIASSRTIDIDSANIRGMFSAGGDLSYNSGTGEFSFDVESVYTKENFDSDYFFAKDSANTAVERNKHDATTKNFAVTVATQTADHVYNGTGSSNKYVIDGTQSPIIQLQIGRTYRFTLSSSDMSSHPFRFYYDAARTTQYTTGVTTTATYAEIAVTEATPPVLHYQCSSHAYMGHALVIGTRNLTGFTTTNLTEGSNLYYTDGRFDTRLAAKTTDNLSEGSSNLYYTDARVTSVLNNNVTFGGDVTFDSANAIIFDKSEKELKFGDNYFAKFGNADDLQIYHNGTHSYIRDQGTGHLYITTNGDFIHLGNGGALQSGKFSPAGAAELFYNGNKKFETTNYGATVTGILSADSATFTGHMKARNATISNNNEDSNLYATLLVGARTANDGYASLQFNYGPNQFASKIDATASTTAIWTDKNSISGERFQVNYGSADETIVLKPLAQTRLIADKYGAIITGRMSVDSATISGLNFPTSDGLNNQVIKTDGAGNLSFVSVAAISGAIDSEAVIDLIDSAYVQARTSAGTDSAATQAMIDSNFTNMDIDLHMPDNQKITFGNDSDLKIYHDGSNSIIQEAGTGLLDIKSSYARFTNVSGTKITATFADTTGAAGGAQLYFDGTKRFETKDSGVNIIGNLRVNNAPFTSGITVQEEGSSLSTAGTTLNFVGDGVTASGTGATKTITISGGGGGGATGIINNVGTSSFVGDSSTTQFTLAQTPADSDDAFVFINGLLQQTNTYSISGQTLTLDSAPDAGDEIEVRTHLLQSANFSLRDYKSYIYTLDETLDSVSGVDSSGVNSLTYDAGFVDVFANGAKLVSGKDYTATNGTQIVFDSAFHAGNIIEVVSHAKAKAAELNGILTIDSDLTTSTADQIVYTYNALTHRTLKFTAQIEHDSSSSYHAEEVLITHNGTNVAMTTYAQVLLDSNLGTFDADINSGNVRLKFSPTKTNTSLKLRAIRTPA